MGYRLVRLIHLDESGISNLKEESHVVVAGTISEPDVDYINIESILLALAHSHVPKDKVDVFRSPPRNCLAAARRSSDQNGR